MEESDLHIYRLIPDAPATDPGWDLAPPIGEIVVRARSVADARIVASEAEPDFPDLHAKPGDDVETAFASAVRDTKLYRVEEVEDGTFPREGQRQVLRGATDAQVIKPQTEV
jgi:hypothetical protein